MLSEGRHRITHFIYFKIEKEKEKEIFGMY
jgi:hypothetical protein